MKNNLNFSDFLKVVFSNFDKKEGNTGLVSICLEIPCIELFDVYEFFVDNAMMVIINNPINRDVYAVIETIFLLRTRFTME